MRKMSLDFFACNLDWAFCKKLIKHGVVRGPQIYQDTEDGTVWQLSIGVGDADAYEVQRDGLCVLAACDSKDFHHWPSLDAARLALRKAGYKGGVTVHFWEC